jgi:hypothetical protein
MVASVWRVETLRGYDRRAKAFRNQAGKDSFDQARAEAKGAVSVCDMITRGSPRYRTLHRRSACLALTILRRCLR